MSIVQVKGQQGDRLRAGTQILTLLSVPTNIHVLRALSSGPCSLLDLRRAAGSPAQTTFRGHLQSLTTKGILEKHRREQFPGSVEYQLAEAGRELLVVADALAAWLSLAPKGGMDLGGSAAKSSVRALVDGWTTRMVRALAARPLSLTELDALISSVNYPSLERRLSAMRLDGLVEPRPSERRGTHYGVSDWLRQAVAPLVTAAHWERRFLRESAPAITAHDAEAALLLVLPLLRLADDLIGSCYLGVQVTRSDQSAMSGAVARVERGKVLVAGTRLDGRADAWALGSVGAWLSAVIEREPQSLELGGDSSLALSIVEELHRLLFWNVRAQPESL